MDRDLRDFHISRLFDFRKIISQIEGRASSLGFKISEASTGTTALVEGGKGPDTFPNDPQSSPIKNENGKREREDLDRGLQFETFFLSDISACMGFLWIS